MKKAIYVWLSLIIAASFLPSIAMEIEEEESSLEETNMMLLLAAEADEPADIEKAIKRGATIFAIDPYHDDETAWQKAVKFKAFHSLNTLIEYDWQQPRRVHNKYWMHPLIYFKASNECEKFKMTFLLAAFDTRQIIFDYLFVDNPKLTFNDLNRKTPEEVLNLYATTCGKAQPSFNSRICNYFAMSISNVCLINENASHLNRFFDPKLKKDTLEQAKEQLAYYIDLFKIATSKIAQITQKKISLKPDTHAYLQTCIEQYPKSDLLNSTVSTLNDIINKQEKYVEEIQNREKALEAAENLL